MMISLCQDLCKIMQKTAKMGVFLKLRLRVLKKKIFTISFQLFEDKTRYNMNI